MLILNKFLVRRDVSSSVINLRIICGLHALSSINRDIKFNGLHLHTEGVDGALYA